MNFGPMDMPPMPPMPPVNKPDARSNDMGGQATDMSVSMTKDLSLPEVKDLSLPEPKDLSVKNLSCAEELQVPNSDSSNAQSHSNDLSQTEMKGSQDSVGTNAQDVESKTQSEPQQMDMSILKSEHPMFPDFSDLQREADIRPEYCSMDDIKPKELMDCSMSMSNVKAESSQSDLKMETQSSSDIKDSFDCKQEMPDVKIKLDSPMSELNGENERDSAETTGSVSGDRGKYADDKVDGEESQGKIAGTAEESEIKDKSEAISESTESTPPQNADDDSKTKNASESKDENGEETSAKEGDESKVDGEKEAASFLDQIDEIFNKEPEVVHRKFKLHCINDNLKTTVARAKIVGRLDLFSEIILRFFEELDLWYDFITGLFPSHLQLSAVHNPYQ
jgi:hypothetical protein